jgi:hypothetical protein
VIKRRKTAQGEYLMVYQQLRLEQVVTAATGFKGPEGVTVDRDDNVYGGGTDGDS